MASWTDRGAPLLDHIGERSFMLVAMLNSHEAADLYGTESKYLAVQETACIHIQA